MRRPQAGRLKRIGPMAIRKPVLLVCCLALLCMGAVSCRKKNDRFTPPDGLYPVVVKGKVGYVNKKGKIKIKAQFEAGMDFHEGMARVRSSDKYGFINRKGEVAINYLYDDAQFFNEGLAPVKLKGKWGFINKKGREIIEPEFELVDVFCGGVARFMLVQNTTSSASSHHKTGYINKKGETAIEARYEDAGRFHQGLAYARIGMHYKYFAVDSKKRPIKERKNWNWDKYTYINKKGEPAFAPAFDEARNFSEGVAAVRKGKKWGYINGKARFVIAPQFDDAGSFYQGLAAVRNGDKWGFVNRKGHIVVNPQYSLVRGFSGSLAPVRTDDKLNPSWGYVDRKGKTRIKPRFFTAGVFQNGLARVTSRNKKGHILFGYINKSGRPVWGPREYTDPEAVLLINAMDQELNLFEAF